MLGYYKMSLIGFSKQEKEGGVCQDASDVIVLENGWVAAAVADGLGSKKKSEIGAAVAVKTVLSFLSENYPDKWHEESLISLLRTAYHKALKTIREIAAQNQDRPGDYDTTLTTAIYNGTNLIYGHVGDGGIIALSSYGEYSLLTEAQKGEAFNVTCPLRGGPEFWTFGSAKEDVCAFIMMTDGIYDIAVPWLLKLDSTDQPIYVNFVRPFMDNHLLKLSTQADFEKIQEEIKVFFSGPDVRQITDDKTIVGVLNTDVTPDIKPDAYYVEPDWEALHKKHHDMLYGKTDGSLDAPEADAKEDNAPVTPEADAKEDDVPITPEADAKEDDAKRSKFFQKILKKSFKKQHRGGTCRRQM